MIRDVCTELLVFALQLFLGFAFAPLLCTSGALHFFGGRMLLTSLWQAFDCGYTEQAGSTGSPAYDLFIAD